MRDTETDYAGYKDGKCWTVATKFAGKGANEANARTVADMVRKGYEIREMPRAEAVQEHLKAIKPGTGAAP